MMLLLMSSLLLLLPSSLICDSFPWILSRLLFLTGWIPGAVIYGKVFDAYCDLWEEQSSSQDSNNALNDDFTTDETTQIDVAVVDMDAVEGGACLLYDLKGLRFGFIGLTLLLQVCA